VAAGGGRTTASAARGRVIRDGSADANARYAAAFGKGLNETGTVEGQNVTVEYHWLEGRHDRLPTLLADLVRRQVAVIATAGNGPTLAAKAATATIPIVFGVGEDPVRLGIVGTYALPGGNATGMTFIYSELGVKRLEILRQFVPNAPAIAILINPNYAPALDEVRDVQAAARSLGGRINVLNA
jgi:putative ABC transport system substrate-binding protein